MCGSSVQETQCQVNVCDRAANLACFTLSYVDVWKEQETSAKYLKNQFEKGGNMPYINTKNYDCILVIIFSVLNNLGTDECETACVSYPQVHANWARFQKVTQADVSMCPCLFACTAEPILHSRPLGNKRCVIERIALTPCDPCCSGNCSSPVHSSVGKGHWSSLRPILRSS